MENLPASAKAMLAALLLVASPFIAAIVFTLLMLTPSIIGSIHASYTDARMQLPLPPPAEIRAVPEFTRFIRTRAGVDEFLFREYFVIVHHPRDMMDIYELIDRFDTQNPFSEISIGLPQDGVVLGYVRTFLQIDDYGTLRHWIYGDGINPFALGIVTSLHDERIVSAFQVTTYSPLFGTPDRLDHYSNVSQVSDPTNNGLFCLLPEQMLPEEVRRVLPVQLTGALLLTSQQVGFWQQKTSLIYRSGCPWHPLLFALTLETRPPTP